MTTPSSKPAKAFKILPKDGISAVWLVPIVALLFGAWLIVKSVSERGVFITLQLDDAGGIVAEKTKVKYKGLDAGVVRDVDVTDDMQGVIVSIEMLPSTKEALTEHTKFWLVSADVSLQGVKGLDTLLSGSYINMAPDLEEKGKPKRDFIALDDEPVLDQAVPGLHISLVTSALGSIAKNSPVTFKQIQVGYVSGFHYQENTNQVEISLFIEPEHQHLVKKNSRFWNASGFDITGSITSGIQVKTESFASIITGGIAFDTDDFDEPEPVAENNDSFVLHSDYAAAEMATTLIFTMAFDSGIGIGAPIKYHGIELGRVTKFLKMDPENSVIRAEAHVNPRVARFLTEDTEFFVLRAQVDLSGVTNLSTLFTGAYIGMRPSNSGAKSTEFTIYNEKPAYKYTEPGLHLVLKAKGAASLKIGSSIFYKKQPVGTVQAVETVGPDDINVHIHINEKYQNYVSADSRFWHVSGFKVSGGIQHFEIEAQSVQAMLTGGIAFDKGVAEDRVLPSNGTTFTLYEEKNVAKQRASFTLTTSSKRSLSRNTRIMYRGEVIGSIHKIDNNPEHVKVYAGIRPNYMHLLREDSQFWLVRPKVSLSGITDTDALFGGAYINVNEGKGKPSNEFVLNSEPPAKHESSDGLQLSLTFDRGSVVNPGSPISYRGIWVGQVDNVSLSEDGNNVDINITITDKYRHLINNFTRFFNVSGITVSGGLGNFIVKTESADTILQGGISFFNPEEKEDTKAVSEYTKYRLYSNVEHARNAGLTIEIYFNDISGLKEGTVIKYQDQEVGLVEHLVFDTSGYGVTAFALLNDKGRRFAAENAKFWLAEPELGLVGSKNISGLLDGGFIAMIPGTGAAKTKFKAKDVAPVIEELTYGLNVKLVADKLGSVRVGNPVLYKQVRVGKVIGVGLSDNADKVNIFINITKRFESLVTPNSKFWNTSGFTVDAGVFSGVTIDSESMETILAGGIAFATPEADDDQPITQAEQNSTFTLHEVADEDWHDWKPSIPLNK